MTMENMEDLFHHELNDIYAAEHKVSKELVKIASESLDRDIKNAFSSHQKETQNQIKRLDNVFKKLNSKPKRTTCAGINGLFEEKKDFKKERPSKEIMDHFHLGAGQKVERYEITAYEHLIEMAHKLGKDEVIAMLEENLREEVEALSSLKNLMSKKTEFESVRMSVL